MPKLVSTSRTSSSLNGLIMAITIFILVSNPFPGASSLRRGSVDRPVPVHLKVPCRLNLEVQLARKHTESVGVGSLLIKDRANFAWPGENCRFSGLLGDWMEAFSRACYAVDAKTRIADMPTK